MGQQKNIKAPTPNPEIVGGMIANVKNAILYKVEALFADVYTYQPNDMISTPNSDEKYRAALNKVAALARLMGVNAIITVTTVNLDDGTATAKEE